MIGNKKADPRVMLETLVRVVSLWMTWHLICISVIPAAWPGMRYQVDFSRSWLASLSIALLMLIANLWGSKKVLAFGVFGYAVMLAVFCTVSPMFGVLILYLGFITVSVFISAILLRM